MKNITRTTKKIWIWIREGAVQVVIDKSLTVIIVVLGGIFTGFGG